MIKEKMNIILGSEKINNVSLGLGVIGLGIMVYAGIRWGGIGMYDDMSQMIWGIFFGLVFISWSFIHHRNIVSGRDYDRQILELKEELSKMGKAFDSFILFFTKNQVPAVEDVRNWREE